jgi:hypothetical protein
VALIGGFGYLPVYFIERQKARIGCRLVLFGCFFVVVVIIIIVTLVPVELGRKPAEKGGPPHGQSDHARTVLEHRRVFPFVSVF